MRRIRAFIIISKTAIPAILFFIFLRFVSRIKQELIIATTNTQREIGEYTLYETKIAHYVFSLFFAQSSLIGLFSFTRICVHTRSDQIKMKIEEEKHAIF